jgi:putative Mg2+ transporter-C (MgtC) family protein
MTGELAVAGGATPNIEGWVQAAELGLALLLSAAIGVEREIRQKSAGLRTYTLVGVGSALFILVSKYAFSDVLIPNQVVADPSRVAAQIVSGIGFLGAGLIFVRRDAVRGLTTAAAVWVTAAVGAAAGGGLPLLAVLATVVYFLVALAFPALTRRLPRSVTAVSTIRVRYPDGHGTLREIVRHVTERGFAVDELSTSAVGDGLVDGHRGIEVELAVHGRGTLEDLAASLSELPGVTAVTADDVNAVDA